MKRYLSLILILVFISQQAFGEYVIYDFKYSHTGTRPDGSSVYFFRYDPSGQRVPNIGETVIIRKGNEVYKAVYIENITEGGETGPYFETTEFIGTANSDEGAIQLYEGGLSTEVADVPPTSTPAQSQQSNGSSTHEDSSSSQGNGGAGPDVGSPFDSFMDGVGDIGTSGIMNGAIAGAAVAVSRGLIYTDEVQEYFNQTNAAVKESEENIKQSKERVSQFVQQTHESFIKFIHSLGDLTNSKITGGSSVRFAEGRSTQFASKNLKFTKELTDITGVLDSAKAETLSQQHARALGYNFVTTADQSYAAGSYADAYAYRNYALAMADIAVGLDPVSGSIRSVYEAFSGKNLVTGETLTTTERAFAVAGALSLGYGNKLGQGFKAISKMVAGGKFSKALGVAAVRAKNLIDNNFITKAFKNRQLDKYYDYLRQSDPDSFKQLQKHFDQFPENKEKYLSYLKDRDGMEIKYHVNSNKVLNFQQGRSVEALQELEKALDAEAVFVRYGGKELSMREKLTYISQNKEIPRPTRVNINTTNPTEAPVHWARYDKGIDAGSARNDFGLYSKGDSFEEYARLKPGAKIITNQAPGGQFINNLTGEVIKTSGGKVEVIIEAGGAETFKFVIKE